MPYWIIDLDEKGKPLMFGPYWSDSKAEVYRDKNCSRWARVTSKTKTRDRHMAKKELVDEIKELLRDRGAVLARGNR